MQNVDFSISAPAGYLIHAQNCKRTYKLFGIEKYGRIKDSFNPVLKMKKILKSIFLFNYVDEISFR